MKSRFSVVLNDIALEGLNEDICITDISYPAPAAEYAVSQYAGRSGGVAVRTPKREAVVSVTFELHIYSTQQRQNACQEIIAWAKAGGRLQTSDRVDQYLQCVCTKLPSIGSALNWTEQLTVEFTAYAVPYWRGVIPSKTTISGASAQGVIFVQGNAETRPSVKITANAAITELTVGFGDTSITLSGINLAAEDVVTIEHDANGILSIMQGQTSLLNKRTALSSDDLIADCGNIAVTIEADGEAVAEFGAEGGWD